MIETKKIDHDEGNYINDLLAFGWQPTEEIRERHGHHHRTYQILGRETTMKNYNKLKDYENKYEDAKEKLQYYSKADGLTVLLLFILFIFPCFIYLAVKSSQKEKVETNNNECHRIMNEAVEEAKKISY